MCKIICLQKCLTFKSQKATAIDVNAASETVTLDFAQPCTAGSEVVLSMDFKGIHNDKMAGFYRSGYKDASGVKK